MGVFIPIEEWMKLKDKYKEIGRESIEIPEWHKDIVNDRMADYEKNPGSSQDFDKAIDDIENEL